MANEKFLGGYRVISFKDCVVDGSTANDGIYNDIDLHDYSKMVIVEKLSNLPAMNFEWKLNGTTYEFYNNLYKFTVSSTGVITLNNTNKTFDLNITFPTVSDIEFTKEFGKIAISNNVCIISAIIGIENTSGNVKSSFSVDINCILNDEISSKIYDVNGKSIAESQSLSNIGIGGILISNTTQSFPSLFSTNSNAYLINRSVENMFTISFSSEAIGANTKQYVEMKIIWIL